MFKDFDDVFNKDTKFNIIELPKSNSNENIKNADVDPSKNANSESVEEENEVTNNINKQLANVTVNVNEPAKESLEVEPKFNAVDHFQQMQKYQMMQQMQMMNEVSVFQNWRMGQLELFRNK